MTTRSAHPLGQPGELLGYSGPLGSARPVPLQSARLLAITRGEGVLALLCMLDEIRCWLPWVQVRLLHDGLPLERLPNECRAWLRKQATAPRDSSSGWRQLTHQLQEFRPDTVYGCAPAQVARQAARMCWQKGVSPRRIWLRSDHMPQPIWGARPSGWAGPTLRQGSGGAQVGSSNRLRFSRPCKSTSRTSRPTHFTNPARVKRLNNRLTVSRGKVEVVGDIASGHRQVENVCAQTAFVIAL